MIKEINYAKALGIFLVIYGHVIGLDSNVPNYASYILRFIYLFHMPLFFVLSGIIKGVRQQNVLYKKGNFWNSFKHLIIPYFIWSFVYVALSCLGNMGEWKSILYERAWAIISGRGIAPMWFLVNLFLAKIVFDYVMSIYAREKVEKVLKIIVVSALLSIVCSFVFERIEIHNILYQYPVITLFRIPVTIFFISIGYLIGVRWDSMILLSKEYGTSIIIISTMTLGVSVAVCPQGNNFHTFNFDKMLIFLISGIFGSLLVLTLSFMITKIPFLDFFGELGKRTMDIMALHYPPFPIIKGLLWCFSVLRIIKIYTVLSAATLLLCYLISKYCLDPFRGMIYRKIKTINLRGGGKLSI